MHIFLDTSVLYKDPFLKGNFFQELIDIVTEKEVELYISNIVLQEIERNYKKIILEENSKLSKLIDQIKHYEIDASFNNLTFDIDKSVTNLKSNFDKLINDGVLKLINYSNDMLPEIVDRAIWRKKPFTESKTELKDAIIWLSYSGFAENNNLNNCILLTDNVSDFCNPEKLKQQIFEIHPDLEKDSKRFRIYKSPRELIQNEKATFQFISQKFNVWLEEQNFDEEFIIRIINDNFMQNVERKIERKFERIELHHIFYEDYYLDGYVTTFGFDINSVEDIEINVFDDDCILSGILYVDCEVEGYQYNPVRDPGEDRHNFYGETTVLAKLPFSFYYDKNEIARNFEIEAVEIELTD